MIHDCKVCWDLNLECALPTNSLTFFIAKYLTKGKPLIDTRFQLPKGKLIRFAQY